MPIPSRKDGEDRKQFMSRCMSDTDVRKEYKDDQRVAVCLSKACEGMDYVQAADFTHGYENYGYTEDITEANFVIPEEEDYVDFGEDVTEWDVAADRPGLWENIRRKKEREGKSYKPAKTVKEGRPTQDQLKKAQSDKPGAKDPRRTPAPKKSEAAEAIHKYKNPKTGEIYQFERKGIYKKDNVTLVPVTAAEYQGRKVKLGKPFRTPDGPKKRSVYVKNEKGNVVKVNFGDPNMKIRKSDPARRKSFRARHKCETPGPKWKARYWS